MQRYLLSGSQMIINSQNAPSEMGSGFSRPLEPIPVPFRFLIQGADSIYASIDGNHNTGVTNDMGMRASRLVNHFYIRPRNPSPHGNSTHPVAPCFISRKFSSSDCWEYCGVNTKNYCVPSKVQNQINLEKTKGIKVGSASQDPNYCRRSHSRDDNLRDYVGI